ncbi:helix-turn-helix domain-containing protein [Desulfovirgula thermocuniculi]|uniref:helix-turn-helix domain-containing protein n=1 Tax=Desulfovirgula thermocuniculi TaxID=348842 RepID=UPI000429A3B7|nr:helix-turn-helix domain-containing protein [Desulfovirgula thermocuniculi]
MEIGSILRQAREARGLTLEQVEEETKIRLRYLAALEEEKFALLPGRFFAKSFLRTYARYLGLDAEALVARFEDLYPPEKEETGPVMPRETGIPGANMRRAPRLAYVLVGLACVVLILFWGAAQFGHQGSLRDVPQGGAPLASAPPPEAKEPGQPPPPPEAPKAEGINLVLKVFDESCWMRVEVDGRTAFTGEVLANESKTFQAKERIRVKLGNAGVVNVQINGRDLGVLGERGQVVSREFLASNRG